MRQQRISVDSIHIFLVAGEQEQALTVQTGREVLPAQLHDIVAFALAVAGGQAARQRRQAKAQLFKHLPLSRCRRPDIGVVRGGGIDQGGHRLRRQFHFFF